LAYGVFNLEILGPMEVHAGIDLSIILGGETKILGGKVVKCDKCMGISQLLGGTWLRTGLPIVPFVPWHGVGPPRPAY